MFCWETLGPGTHEVDTLTPTTHLHTIDGQICHSKRWGPPSVGQHNPMAPQMATRKVQSIIHGDVMEPCAQQKPHLPPDPKICQCPGTRYHRTSSEVPCPCLDRSELFQWQEVPIKYQGGGFNVVAISVVSTVIYMYIKYPLWNGMAVEQGQITKTTPHRPIVTVFVTGVSWSEASLNGRETEVKCQLGSLQVILLFRQFFNFAMWQRQKNDNNCTADSVCLVDCYLHTTFWME